jgi:hypothetical protein
LWESLRRIPRESPPTIAAIVDLGNDIAYGASVEQVLGWLQWCLDWLALRDAEVVLMALPTDNLERLTRWRFELVRRVYFPSRSLSWPAVLEQLGCLQEQVCELARRYDVRVVQPSALWYGFDPIHVLRCRESCAWHTLFSGWRVWKGPVELRRPTWAESFRLRRLRPADYRWFGYRRTVPQPVFDGRRVSLSLY